GPADDLLAFLEAREDLEVLLAGDPDLYGPEGDFVVRADNKHAFDVLLADLLGVRRAPERDGCSVRVLELLVLPDGQRDDRNGQCGRARIRHDLRRGGEVRTRVLRRIEELDCDLVIHGLVSRTAGRRGRTLDGAVRN